MKLASAERIVAISPIEGADVIEKATVLGWDVVVKKGEFKVGDLVAYIQIDTIVPEKPEFEFLRQRDFRVRTIKLRKQISQGLIIPLESFAVEGEDLTEALGIKKYSKPEAPIVERKMSTPKTLRGRLWQRFQFTVLFKLFPSLQDRFYPRLRADFPSHLVSKTDEERIQNMKRVLETHKGKLFHITEKLDGSSITIINDKKGLRVCSRNNEILTKDNEWWKVVEDTGFAQHIIDLAHEFNTPNVIVQGEYIGKPQSNKYKVDNQIRLFNIFIDGNKLAPDTFQNVCRRYKIPTCPFLGEVTLDTTLEEIIKLAEGKSQLNKDVEREGLVFRCIEDNASFKVISNKFLLKNNE
jgi:hypothetical protein